MYTHVYFYHFRSGEFCFPSCYSKGRVFEIRIFSPDDDAVDRTIGYIDQIVWIGNHFNWGHTVNQLSKDLLIRKFINSTILYFFYNAFNQTKPRIFDFCRKNDARLIRTILMFIINPHPNFTLTPISSSPSFHPHPNFTRPDFNPLLK